MSALIQIPGGTFNPEIHQYLDEHGREIPSVTQIFDSLGFTDFDNVPGKTLERKRAIGDAAHFACDAIDKGQDLDWSTLDPEVAPYVLAWMNFKDEVGFEVLESEVSGIWTVNGMRYAFTRDKVGRWRGQKYVVELKCAYREEPTWKYQLAAYQRPIMGESEFVARLAVQLKPDGGFKPYPYDDPRDWDRFVCLLAAVNIKLSEGIRWRR